MDNAIEQGWLAAARQCPSPNYNDRPAHTPVSLLVIHNISLPPGSFGNGCIEAFFCNRLDPEQDPYFQTIRDLRVSSHFLIERSGELVQFVSCDHRAWHAGASRYEGRSECNDFSIGIELEGTDETPYTEAQYCRLVAVTRVLLAHYPAMSADRIAGHCDIAPGRKTDPGPAFDWDYFRAQL